MGTGRTSVLPDARVNNIVHQGSRSRDISEQFYFLRLAESGDGGCLRGRNRDRDKDNNRNDNTVLQATESVSRMGNGRDMCMGSNGHRGRKCPTGTRIPNDQSGNGMVDESQQRRSLLFRISRRLKSGNGHLPCNGTEGRDGRIRVNGSRSSWMQGIFNSFRNRTNSNAGMKAGVFEFDCDCQTAMAEVRAVLEREYFGVPLSERVNEARMRVPLTVAGKLTLINIIIKGEPKVGARSRVTIRRAFGDALYIRHEDFDWFCFDVYRRLLKVRVVIRPLYS